MTVQEPSLTHQIAAAFEWWRDAGVDSDYRDDATDWLAQSVTAPEANTAASVRPAVLEETINNTPQEIDLLGDSPPSDLAAFEEFWINDPKLALAGTAPRIAPRGPSGAKLMVVVPSPERDDTSHLLSSAQGRLLGRMLSAMSLSEDEVYFASAVPQAMPLVDGEALLEAGFGKLLAHHVSLVSPERLLVFGRNISPLLQHDAAQQPDSVHEFAAGDKSIPLLLVEELDALAGMPRLKARFWRRWLAHLAA